MEAKDDDFGSIAWPGFVDILSTVIMMFLFFIMIVSIVMYVMSMEYKKNVEVQSEAKVKSQVDEEVQKMLQKLNAGEITIEQIKNASKSVQQNQSLSNENNELKNQLKQADSTIDQIKADMASGLKQDTRQTSDGFFVILFEKNDISVSPETTDTLNAYTESIMKVTGAPMEDLKVEILAGDNPNAPTISVARELGLARALNLRNVFIKAKVKPENITVKYVPADSIKDSYNWIKLKVSRK